MSDLAYTVFGGLPQLSATEQFDDFDMPYSEIAYSPRSMEDMLVDSEHLCRTGAVGLPVADYTRPANLEQRISSLEKSVAGNHSYQSMDDDKHGSHYLPIQNTAPLPPPQMHTNRYTSPSGSQGGDISATGSMMSDHSWMMVQNHHHSGSPSPMVDNFGLPDLFSPASLMPAVEGSYCGSDYSVNPSDLQHYPDLSQQVHTPPPENETFAPYEHQTAHPLLPYASHESEFQYGIAQFEPQPDIDPLLHQPHDSPEPPLKRLRIASNPEMMPHIKTPPESPKKKHKPTPINPNARRPQIKRGTKHHGASSPAKVQTWALRKKPERQFPCVFAPYGCTLVLVSKNEWKRHVMSQHLQLGFFRCDVGNCNIASPSSPATPCSDSNSLSPSSAAARTPNDFNRKDLFTQHQRRMHAPWRVPGSPTSPNQPAASEPSKRAREAFEASLDDVRERCWIEQRKAPLFSQCTYCSAEFKGPTCWETRMEHVGKHCENGDVEIRDDMGLREWAVREGVVSEVGKGRWALVGGQRGGRRGGSHSGVVGGMMFFN